MQQLAKQTKQTHQKPIMAAYNMEMEIQSHKFIEEDALGRIFHVGLFISLMNHCVKRRGKKGKKIELLFVPSSSHHSLCGSRRAMGVI